MERYERMTYAEWFELVVATAITPEYREYRLCIPYFLSVIQRVASTATLRSLMSLSKEQVITSVDADMFIRLVLISRENMWLSEEITTQHISLTADGDIDPACAWSHFSS